MDSPILNPHDRLFRFAFSDLTVAKDFVANCLPNDISSTLDVESLRAVDGSFVDEEMRPHHSDALFRVNLQPQEDRAAEEEAAQEVLVYLLVEHKSYPDRMTARQVLRYIERIWRREERNRPPQSSLVAVLPIVFYHGITRWQTPRELVELINAPASFIPYQPNLRLLVWDLNKEEAYSMAQTVQLRLLIRLMELIRADNPEQRLPELAALLQQLLEPKTMMEWVQVGLYYLTANKRVGQEDAKRIVRQLLPRDEEERGDAIMTAIAEVWYKDGLEDGLEQGREQGLEQGRQGVLRAVERVVSARFGAIPPSVADQLAAYDLERLNEAHSLALEVRDLNEFVSRLGSTTT